MVNGSVCVLGAGGHTKVVIQTLREAGYDVQGLYDDDPNKVGDHISGVPVRGSIEIAAQECSASIIGIGDNRTRRTIVQRLPGMRWVSAIHPRAVVAPDVETGVGTVVFAGAVIQPGTVIGEHVIINTGATVDHDCVIGDYAHIAPGVHLAGEVQVGAGAFMGTGSVAIVGVVIGAWATIGAGAVVIEDIPPGTTAVGVPARVIKTRDNIPTIAQG
jgi:sugar O-acyltransferase (sialic acid O-acetyltransferase NeuD family)